MEKRYIYASHVIWVIKMNENKIREIVSTFLKVDQSEIVKETMVDESVIQGSVLFTRMISLLKAEGLNIEDETSIHTFNDLLVCNYSSLNSIPEDGVIKEIEISDSKENNSSFPVGIDIQKIVDIPLAIDYREDPFIKGNFTKREISHCLIKVDPRASFSGIFSAKEAIKKANGKYLKKSFQDIEIMFDDNGKPYYKDFSLSISHSGEYSTAISIQTGLQQEAIVFDSSKLKNEIIREIREETNQKNIVQIEKNTITKKILTYLSI